MNCLPAKSFASDNNSGVHPAVWEAMARVNAGDVPAYGDDPVTRAVEEQFKAEFGPDIAVYLVFNGTGANVMGLKSVVQSYQAVICAESAHINVDECGAVEANIGCKLITLPAADGKITVAQIAACLGDRGNQHHNQPKVVSITESTEFGTVYTPEEIRAITTFAHQHGLLVHMDGARLANAAATLGVRLQELTSAAGVDLLSFGGTKNGLMFGEAVVFLRPELGAEFKYLRKQQLQLMAKLRFLAAQFQALFTDELWLQNARHANAMARLLATELEQIPQISITQKVQVNAVFAIFPPQVIPQIQGRYYFYVWNEAKSEVRLMTSFNTSEADVRDFVQVVKEALARHSPLGARRSGCVSCQS